MSISTCTKDQPCIDTLGAGSCCMAMKIKTLSANPTAQEQSFRDLYKTIGIELKAGETFKTCQNKATVNAIEAQGDKYPSPFGGTIQMFCDSAYKAAAAMGTLAVATAVIQI